MGKDLAKLVDDMEKSLEAITKWLKQSGLVVNQTKTEICLFNRRDCRPISIKLGLGSVLTQSVLNVLGVIFDSRLQWSNQVANCVQKANKALSAIKLIRRFFNTKELLQLLTSNYFSVLYYNSEVWNIGSLKEPLKHQLLTASSNALKLALHYPRRLISFHNLHSITKRATPCMFSKYKLALQLHKIYNNHTPHEEWVHLNFDQVLSSRQTNFIVNRSSKHTVGMNAMTNRLHSLNNIIPLEWLNYSFLHFKISCKTKLLTFTN